MRRLAVPMEVYTDLPGVQFYTANSLKTRAWEESCSLYPKMWLLLWDPVFPDAINKPEFTFSSDKSRGRV